jgi:hypothetical protein
MKRNFLITLITILVVVGCKKNIEPTSETTQSAADIESAEIIQKLQGTYSACIVSPTYPGYWNKVVVTVTNNVYDYSFELSGNSACTSPYYHNTYKFEIDRATYTTPGDTENINIDFKVTNLKIRYNLAYYIGQNYCGMTDWVLGVDKDVTGIACTNLLSLYDTFHNNFKSLNDFEYQQLKLTTTNLTLPFGYVQSGDSEAARKLLVVKTATIPKI